MWNIAEAQENKFHPLSDIFFLWSLLKLHLKKQENEHGLCSLDTSEHSHQDLWWLQFSLFSECYYVTASHVPSLKPVRYHCTHFLKFLSILLSANIHDKPNCYWAFTQHRHSDNQQTLKINTETFAHDWFPSVSLACFNSSFPPIITSFDHYCFDYRDHTSNWL